MSITIEAIYENGVLRPIGPLSLKEHDKDSLTIHPPTAPQRGNGLVH